MSIGSLGFTLVNDKGQNSINTVLELQVYLAQVLYLFKMSFIDGSPSIFISLLTSEQEVVI